MHVLWGCLIVAAGLFMLVCGRRKSDFVVYRLMAVRSKILWGENVHRFYQIVGVIVQFSSNAIAPPFAVTGRSRDSLDIESWNLFLSGIRKTGGLIFR
tara:strand:+ start:9369 stop:9662 length:294 start_codon:yes stop_codon:yes gene_type:complete